MKKPKSVNANIMVTPEVSNQGTCPFCKKSCKSLFSQTDKKTEYIDVFFVYRCNKCAVEFINPPKNLAKFYKENYFFDMVEQKDILYRFKKFIIKSYYVKRSILSSFLINFISAMPPSVNKGKKIIDIGCGPGDVLYLLKNAGFDVYGLDISDHAVKIANEHGLINVVQGTELDLFRYGDNFFGYIRASHVLEHMIDPIGFVNLCFKKLEKDGQLLIQTPNINSLGKLFGREAKYYSDIPRHIILFSTKAVNKILRDVGFVDVRVSYTSMFSDFRDNIVLALRAKFNSFKNSLPDKLLNSLVFNFLLLPIDLLAGSLGVGQTLTVVARKP